MSANDSDSKAIVKASERRIVANRRNSLKSTGPRTQTGKTVVAKNGTEHGIYAFCPVIEGMESKRSWTAYRFAMLDSLAPVGMIEITLAERIILTAWRQRRAARYETEQIRLTQESAAELVGVQLGLEREFAANGVEEIMSDGKWRDQSWQTVQRFGDASDEAPLSLEEADDLLWHVHEELGIANSFDAYWQRLEEPERWTVGFVGQLVRSLAERCGKDFDELLQALKKNVLSEAVKSGRVAREVNHQIEEFRRENLLPDNETLEKVMRYEVQLSRQFHRDLHELQRLQAMRQGLAVAAPLAIDIDLTSGPKLKKDLPD